MLVGTTLFVCALFWRLVEHLSSTIVGDQGSDATGSVAWFWRTQHEGGFHLLGITHHTLTGAPFGWDQTNALNIQVALAYYPTYLAAQVVGSVAAFNLTTLAGYVLSGATMYLLVRYLGVGRLVSAWAALAYIVFPWHMARIEHASLLHIEVLALLILSLVAVTRQPSWLRFGFVAAANLACWIMSGYFGPMAAVTTVAFAVGAGLTTRQWRRAMSVVLGAIGCALLTPALFGIAAVVSGTNAGAGLNRAAGDLSIYGLRPSELVDPRGAQPPPRRPPRHVLERPPARLEPDGDHQLPRPAHDRARDRMARRRDPAPAGALRARHARDGRARRRVRRRASPSPRPSPISLFGHLVWTPCAPALGGRPGAARAVALGRAADDRARAARGAGPPGGGAGHGAPPALALRLDRRRPGRDGRVVPRADDPPGRGPLPHRPRPAGVPGREADPARDPRRVPARLLGHLQPLAEQARPADPQRGPARLAGRPRASRRPRSEPARHGRGPRAARRDRDRDPPDRPRRLGGRAAGAEAGRRFPARRAASPPTHRSGG